MKKVGKKIVSAVLAASLLITGGSLSFASEQEPVELTGGMGLAEAGNKPPDKKTEATALTGISATEEALFEARMLSQEEALEAHSLLWASFPKDENGWPSSYPEDYAGCYIDEASDLVILLVNPTEESKEAYKELCGNSSRVKFKAAQYSMEELEGYNDEAMKLYEEGYDLVSWGVNEKNNQFKIRVNKEDYNKLSSQFIQTRSTSPVVIEESESYIETTATNLYGGQKCEFAGNTSGTIGIGGTYNGKDAIITAGHCPYKNSVYAYNANNQIIGTVVKRKFDNWSAGDYAIIQLNNNYKSTNKLWPIDANIISIEGVRPNIPVGTTIRKYGAVTGYSYGTLKDMGENVTYKYKDQDGRERDVVIYNLCIAVMPNTSSNKTLPGDSGGPVCIISDSKYMITGTISGSNLDKISSGASEYEMAYCDITYPSGSGFKVKTGS